MTDLTNSELARLIDRAVERNQLNMAHFIATLLIERIAKIKQKGGRE